jgi:predicted Co/Zn/Cd cation transporter (cation efflux family)
MSTRNRKLKQYTQKLIEIHPATFQDQVKRHSNGSIQRYSGKRQAKKMAKMGLELERL